MQFHDSSVLMFADQNRSLHADVSRLKEKETSTLADVDRLQQAVINLEKVIHLFLI